MRLFLFFILFLAEAASAQPYPAKAITLVNGFPPGGPTDITLRQIAGKLSERLGQPVVIDNRAGASGTIAGAPEAFGAYVAQEAKRWRDAVAVSGLKLE